MLKGIDEHISKGEVVVVIGPSGSGKSTFLRCLNLLETPTSGQITFEDKDITSKATNIDKMREKWGWYSNNLIYFLIKQSVKIYA